MVPAQRSYEFVFHGVNAAAVVLNGGPVNEEAWRYDPQAETLSVTVRDVAPSQAMSVELVAADGSLKASRDRRVEVVRSLLKSFKLDSRVKGQIDYEMPQWLAGTTSLERYPLSDAQAAALAHAL